VHEPVRGASVQGYILEYDQRIERTIYSAMFYFAVIVALHTAEECNGGCRVHCSNFPKEKGDLGINFRTRTPLRFLIATELRRIAKKLDRGREQNTYLAPQAVASCSMLMVHMAVHGYVSSREWTRGESSEIWRVCRSLQPIEPEVARIMSYSTTDRQ
jgi:hypothetical protein